MAQITIKSFRPVVKNTLRGFAEVAFPFGLVIRDVSIHTKNDKSWASLPAKAQLTSDGSIKRTKEGKAEYSAVLVWETRELSDRFSERVVALVKEGWPDALK